MVRALLRLTITEFSCGPDYLLYPIVRIRSVLSGFTHATPFNHHFRQVAVVSLPGLPLSCNKGT